MKENSCVMWLVSAGGRSQPSVLRLCFAPGLSVALAGRVNSVVDDVRQLLLGDDMWAYLPVRPLLLLLAFEYVRSRVDRRCPLGMPVVE